MHWKLRFKQSIFRCHLKFPNGIVKTTKVLSVSQLNEAVWGYYPGFFVVCPFIILTTDSEEIIKPNSVQITHENYEKYITTDKYFIGITYPNKNFRERNKSAVALCPGPAQNNFGDALRIAEFVELYKLLGIEKFYFYNMSVTSDVDKLFKYYQSVNTIEVLRWDIDRVMNMDEGTIHYYGIMATLNDCFYRATMVDNFKYVMVADFDEIILPIAYKTIPEFLAHQDRDSIHSLVFKNFFVFGKFDSDNSNVPKNSLNKFLYTQAKVVRLKHSTGDYKWNHVRTKLIAKRDKVIEIGNHYVWDALKGSHEQYVDSKDALMLHYRNQCTSDCLKETVKDFSVRRYGEKLWQRVDEVCGQLFSDGVCPGGENKETKPKLTLL